MTACCYGQLQDHAHNGGTSHRILRQKSVALPENSNLYKFKDNTVPTTTIIPNMESNILN
jgi:hypothetical protein